MSTLTLVMMGAAAVSTAAVAGLFYAFSTFVMRALARLDPRAGIAAMQSINVVVLNPLFFALFFGAGVVGIAASVCAVWEGASSSLRGGDLAAISGVAAYWLGCVGVTAACNVPWNDRLASVDASAAESEALWREYVHRWTRWNHVRTAMSFAASVAFTLAIAVRAR